MSILRTPKPKHLRLFKTPAELEREKDKQARKARAVSKRRKAKA